MKIIFLKDVTVDILTDENGETDSSFYSKGSVIDVSEIVPVSKNFSEIVLPSGNVIIDLRCDLFKELV